MISPNQKPLEPEKTSLNQDSSPSVHTPTNKIPAKGLHVLHLSHIIPKKAKGLATVDHLNRMSYPPKTMLAHQLVQKLTRVPAIHKWKGTKRIGFMMTYKTDFHNYLKRNIKFSKLESLKTLYLDIKNCEISEEEMEIIAFTIFRDFPQLINLDLTLSSCTLPESYFEIFNNAANWTLTKIQKLTMKVENCKLYFDESFKSLTTCFMNRFDLNLKFSKCFSDLDNIEIESIKNCKRLNRLSITWPENNKTKPLTEKTHQFKLLNFLRKWTNVQSLEFHVLFPSADLATDEAMKTIAEEILSKYNMQQLTISLKCKFSPSLNSSPNLSDKGIEAFAASLSKLTQLKKLSMRLEWLCVISNKGLNFLGNQLCQGLQGLDNLSLSFKGWTKITSMGANKFVDEICKNMNNLKDLSIEFRDCVGLLSYDLQAVKNKISTFMSQVQKQTS